jgi:hypothetical protein
VRKVTEGQAEGEALQPSCPEITTHAGDGYFVFLRQRVGGTLRHGEVEITSRRWEGRLRVARAVGGREVDKNRLRQTSSQLRGEGCVLWVLLEAGIRLNFR